jgi:hypothetical protein
MTSRLYDSSSHYLQHIYYRYLHCSTSPLFVLSIRGNFYIFEFSLQDICVWFCLYFVLTRIYIIVCVCVLYCTSRCICMYTHGGLTYFSIYIEWKRYRCCHSGGHRKYGSFIRYCHLLGPT